MVKTESATGSPCGAGLGREKDTPRSGARAPRPRLRSSLQRERDRSSRPRRLRPPCLCPCRACPTSVAAVAAAVRVTAVSADLPVRRALSLRLYVPPLMVEPPRSLLLISQHKTPRRPTPLLLLHFLPHDDWRLPHTPPRQPRRSKSAADPNPGDLFARRSGQRRRSGRGLGVGRARGGRHSRRGCRAGRGCESVGSPEPELQDIGAMAENAPYGVLRAASARHVGFIEVRPAAPPPPIQQVLVQRARERMGPRAVALAGLGDAPGAGDGGAVAAGRRAVRQRLQDRDRLGERRRLRAAARGAPRRGHRSAECTVYGAERVLGVDEAKARMGTLSGAALSRGWGPDSPRSLPKNYILAREFRTNPDIY